jgi:hypothetical protein
MAAASSTAVKMLYIDLDDCMYKNDWKVADMITVNSGLARPPCQHLRPRSAAHPFLLFPLSHTSAPNARLFAHNTRTAPYLNNTGN